MRIGIYCAIYTVTNSNNTRCYSDIYTLTICNGANSLDSGTENSAITAISNKKAINCLVYIDIAFFTIHYLNIYSNS
jgi:hypothetical protein